MERGTAAGDDGEGDEAAEYLMRHLEAIGPRPTTLATYRSLSFALT